MSQYPKSPLMGQMMSQPLLISSIIQYADRNFGGNEIVSRRVEGGIHRYTYRDCHKRARQMANALGGLGVKMGDRVATLAWNGYRHLELYYARLGLLNYVGQNNLRFSTFKRTVIGGSACPPAVMKAFRNKYGVEVVHAWGMTEMSPLGTACTLQNHHMALPEEQKQAILEKQGHAIYGVDMKIVGDNGEELPWDGKTYGNLLVRGPWVISSYFKGEGATCCRTDGSPRVMLPSSAPTATCRSPTAARM